MPVRSYEHASNPFYRRRLTIQLWRWRTLFLYLFFSSLTREIKWFSVRQTSGETQQRLIWIKLKVGILDVISQGLSDHLLFMSLQLVFFFFFPSRQHSESQTSLPALVDAAAARTQDVHSKFSVRKHMHPCGRKKRERKRVVNRRFKKSWINLYKSKAPNKTFSSCLRNQKVFGAISVLLVCPKLHFSGL